jgi:hypothetical protein
VKVCAIVGGESNQTYMRDLTLALFVLVITAGYALGQSCPKVTSTGPTDIAVGRSATFIANVSGGDPNVTPTYNWAVSAGLIESGQGTSVIVVDTYNTGGQTITATVDVGGYPPGCGTVSSWTVSVSEPPVARKYDEFPYLGPAKLEAVRLDEVAITLQNEPDAQGVVIFYLGRKGLPGAIQAWTKQTIGHLVKRGIDRLRLISVDGGFRDSGMMEIFIVPAGATAPDPTPTVDPSEITPPAKKPAARKTTRKKS